MTKRIPEMDMIRATSTIAVVLIHLSAAPLLVTLKDGATTSFYLFLNVAARFAVPTFIMLSGMGLALSKRREGYFSFIKRRVRKVVVPYILWSAVYSCTWDEQIGVFHPSIPSFSKLILDLLTGRACYHLYFVVIIVQLYLLYPFTRKWLSSNIGLVISGIIAVTMLCIGQYADVPGRWAFFFDDRNPLGWLFYFGLGIRIAHGGGIDILRSRRLKALLFIMLLTVIGAMMVFVYKTSIKGGIDAGLDALGPVIIVYTLLVNGWLWKLKWECSPLRRLLQVISDKSYLIYLSHALVLMLYMDLLDKAGVEHYGLLFGVVGLVLVIAGCSLFALIEGFLAKLCRCF